MKLSKSTKQLLILGGTLVVLGVVGWFIYNTVVFREIGTSPAKNHVSYLSPYFSIQFNHELKNQEVEVSISPNTVYEAVVHGSSLFIYFDALTVDTFYTITLDEIADTQGKKITNLQYSFMAQGIPYSELSSAEQNEIIKRQDSPTIENSDPIMTYLPYSTLNYNLKGVVVSGGDTSEGTVQVDAEIILYNSDINTGKDSAVAKYKQEIKSYFTTNNINPEEYIINYAITELY